jgi:threonine synthase
VRHISTRGEAPSLGFADAMLAGLARDGGLYVPEAWPRLDRETILGFAGRPYAEVAVEVIRCFTGDSIARPTSPAWRARPTAISAIPLSRR